jgi:hypothetical protein
VDDIFPFQKLPIELRDKIYKLVIGPPRYVQKYVLPLDRRRNRNIGSPPTPPTRFAGFDMMLTCRQFYNEAMPLFWRNDFKILNTSLFKKSNHSFSLNVQNITFHWSGLVKDGDIFTAFCNCSQLKVLTIKFGPPSVMYQDRFFLPNRNVLYQNEADAKTFSKANGFDQLTQIRGVQSISLRKSYPVDIFPTLDADIRKFESFLMRTLTLPKKVVSMLFAHLSQ